jgi:TPP-dependent pyruvate/acetoin dehydrogenase alpha subunit
VQLTREQLLSAYRAMRTIRTFEERIHVEFALGNIPGFVHLYAGQEACAVGMCLNLTDADWIGSTHRGHGHCIAKGCDVELMMHEIFGRRSGLCGGKGGSMHIADLSKGMLGANAIVGGSAPLAVGAALAAATRADTRVAVSFAGDGASNQGTTFEAMNLAVVLKLPVVFVIENNGYGEGTGVGYAVGACNIAARARGFGMPAESIDGTDLFAVYEASRVAVERARRGEGPSMIEARATRFFGHFEGDAELYRATNEVQELRAGHDCLQIFRSTVMERHEIEQGELDCVDAAVEALIERSVASAKAAEFPTGADLCTDVYVSY